MPRWDVLVVGVLALILVVWGISLMTRGHSEFDRLNAQYQAECPQYAAALAAAYDGYGPDETPPDSVHTEKLDDWRSGDIEAVRCQIHYLHASAALHEQVMARQNVFEARIDQARAFDRVEQLALRYFLWRQTGEGLEELEALARMMSRDDVRAGLSMWIFHDHATPTPLRDETGRLSPQDPGYRIVQMARPSQT